MSFQWMAFFIDSSRAGDARVSRAAVSGSRSGPHRLQVVSCSFVLFETNFLHTIISDFHILFMRSLDGHLLLDGEECSTWVRCGNPPPPTIHQARNRLPFCREDDGIPCKTVIQ